MNIYNKCLINLVEIQKLVKSFYAESFLCEDVAEIILEQIEISPWFELYGIKFWVVSNVLHV